MTRILRLVKKFFCLLALSACVFGCQKQQAKEEGSAEGQGRAKLSERERALIESKQETVSHVIPVSMQQIDQEPTNEQQPAEEIENRPTPANKATTPNAVESISAQPEASMTPAATETPILSPTGTPTPAISSTPLSTVQTPEAGKKPVATSTPRLRLNPLSMGTPFPQATVSAEFSLASSPVASAVPTETGSQAQRAAKPDASASATASWIRSASGKKRATPSVSPSSSP
jgi:hypothetical protein